MNNLNLKYSTYANIIIEKYQSNFIYAEEFISHDGFDQYGPQSDLFDLYIIIKEKEEYKILNFYCENRFNNKFFGYSEEPAIHDLKVLYNSKKDTHLINTTKSIADNLIKKGLITI